MVKFQIFPDTRFSMLSSLATRFRSLVDHRIATDDLATAKRLHAQAITSGLLSFPPFVFTICSNLAASYASCGYIPHARRLFDVMPQRSLFLCNAFIKIYMSHNLHYDALNVFDKMLASDQCRPDTFTYTSVIKACSKLSFFDVGLSIHASLFISGFESDSSIQNSLLSLYMNCGVIKAAQKLFDEMPERTVVSWNSLISGYFKNSCPSKAVMVFRSMLDSGLDPDCATIVSVLPACGFLAELELGRKVHTLVGEKGLGKILAVSNALIDMYARCGRMDEAQNILENMTVRDVVTWTTMINSVDPGTALDFCRLMLSDGVKPNPITVSSLLSACATLFVLRHGRCLHGWSIRQNFDSDIHVETALIDMYAKCKRMDLSFKVFRKTSRRRTAPWNALIAGYTRRNLADQAIEAFKEMLNQNVDRDSVTLNGLLPAYAVLADLQLAKNVHCYLTRTGFVSNVEVTTSLIDIYSKCGSLESAHKLFDSISSYEKDIIVWSVIISCYGLHGHGRTAVLLFNEMVKYGVSPNEVTFTSVLHACSHAGLVEEGFRLFGFMVREHDTMLQTDHYTCIVDLLGREGRLDEAYDLIRTMPMKANHAVWGALLGGCVIHGNAKLAEVAAAELFEIEPDNTGNYVQMANIYSASGRWKDAENVRREMNQIGLIKTPAHSAI